MSDAHDRSDDHDAADDAPAIMEGHHDTLPETRFSRAVDRSLGAIGRAASWIWLVLLVVIVLNVSMRYLLGAGRIEFEELQWHLYAAGFLVGLAAADLGDAHIRVDVLRERFTLETRAWIELYGLLLLFFPFVTLVVVTALPFVAESFAQGEVSPSPGGLPLRWAIKGALPAGFALLALAGLSRLTRVSALLFGAPAPARPEPPHGGARAAGRIQEPPRGGA